MTQESKDMLSLSNRVRAAVVLACANMSALPLEQRLDIAKAGTRYNQTIFAIGLLELLQDRTEGIPLERAIDMTIMALSDEIPKQHDRFFNLIELIKEESQT